MRKLLIAFFTVMFLLPISVIAQPNHAAEKNIVNKEAPETWATTWIWLRGGLPPTSSTFTKVDGEGKYRVRLGIMFGDMVLRKTPTSFYGIINWDPGHDRAIITGTIDKNVVSGDWKGDSGHGGTLSGEILNQLLELE